MIKLAQVEHTEAVPAMRECPWWSGLCKLLYSMPEAESPGNLSRMKFLDPIPDQWIRNSAGGMWVYQGLLVILMPTHVENHWYKERDKDTPPRQNLGASTNLWLSTWIIQGSPTSEIKNTGFKRKAPGPTQLFGGSHWTFIETMAEPSKNQL